MPIDLTWSTPVKSWDAANNLDHFLLAHRTSEQPRRLVLPTWDGSGVLFLVSYPAALFAILELLVVGRQFGIVLKSCGRITGALSGSPWVHDHFDHETMSLQEITTERRTGAWKTPSLYTMLSKIVYTVYASCGHEHWISGNFVIVLTSALQ